METVSAFKGDIPRGEYERTWQASRDFDRRKQCVDEGVQAVGYVQGILHDSSV
jgi:hypothetical protein